MDRFKIKIDNKIINKLINICRLCGIDNPQKVQIIEEVFVVEIDDEPSLDKKIYDLVGIEVSIFKLYKIIFIANIFQLFCIDCFNNSYNF